jgi:arsenate reductase
MKKLYYLSSCSTCKRIVQKWGLPREFAMQDVKSNPLTLEDLGQMHERSGSYESLFSRRAKLFQERQLGAEDLDEARYKSLLLEHYTFLKRPVLIWEDQIFIGSSKATVDQAAKTILACG